MAPHKFTPEVQERYLTLLRAGHGRYFSASQCGVNMSTVKRFAVASPEFAEAVADAEEEATEPVEAQLYEAAKAGEPWAVKEWLTKRARGRWGEAPRKVEVGGEVGVALSAVGGLGRVLELQARMEERRSALEEAGVVLEAEYDETPALGAGAP